MTQEDKELLLKDLCERLPYGVKIEGYELPCIILNSDWLHFMYTHQEFALRRPYLRPMSSMTDEEKTTYKNHVSGITTGIDAANFMIWVYKHHLDIFHFIEKGLALEAPEGMYDFK